MRLGNNEEFDPREEEKKDSFRYTMLAVLCVCVVVSGAIFSFQTYPKWMGRGNTTDLNLTEKKSVAQVAEPDKDVVKPVPTVIDSRENPENQTQQKQSGGAKASLTLPVEGKVVKTFSLDAPMYSKTLDQFQIHQGIDIEADTDAQVKAALSGTVTKVYEDDKLGLTIEITHEGGLLTRYSNLSTEKLVEEGDVVKTGDVISGVGSSALFESLDPPHLHFEVERNGAYENPKDFLK